MKIDKEFKSLIPPLGDEELSQLEINIEADGCRDPLVLWGDILIDGHNRYEICNRLNLTFEMITIELKDRDAALIWIIDNQKGRRNISDIDRIALESKRESIIARKAKANQKDHGGTAPGKKKNTSGKIAESVPVSTRKESAKSAGVGERTYDAGKLVLDAAEKGEIPKEDVEDIRRKRKSIHAVAKQVKESREKVIRNSKRAKAAEKTEPQFFDNVHIGDFRDNASKIADGSVSLIFTDPPYDKKSIELFDGLGHFASEKLCDGGSLICYLGHVQLHDAMIALGKHLRFWWPICCLHSGQNALMKEYGIRVGWKPVLWYVKNTRDDKSNIVQDVMSGGKEKTHHDWQQSQSEAEYWIENLCPADGIVCDPFLGGGTTAAAAIKLGRKWVGFEIDHDQAVVAMQRCKP